MCLDCEPEQLLEFDYIPETRDWSGLVLCVVVVMIFSAYLLLLE